jgi:CopG family transcriptional regulator / antitoxin EndoAI
MYFYTGLCITYRICPIICHIKESGVLLLNELKKVLISIPDSLLKEIDLLVAVERTNRSEFVREAMRLYIGQRRKIEMRDRMKKGYQEMAGINIKMCECCFDADCEQLTEYEYRLGRIEYR